MMFIAIWLRFGGGRRAQAFWLADLSRCSGRIAAVSVAPDRLPLTALLVTCGVIEIEFAAGVRMRITGAVDAATLSAVVAALTDGRPR